MNKPVHAAPALPRSKPRGSHNNNTSQFSNEPYLFLFSRYKVLFKKFKPLRDVDVDYLNFERDEASKVDILTIV